MIRYARSNAATPGPVSVALAVATVCFARALVAAYSHRERPRSCVATAQRVVALLAGRRIEGVQRSQSRKQLRQARFADATCPICGSPSAITEQFRPTLLRACTGCGLLSSPAASDDAVRRMYSDDSYSAARIDALTRHRSRDAKRRASWISARVSGRRLLDVGAGAGFFVAEATRQGFEAIGIEPSDLCARYARTKLAADVRTGFLDTVDLPKDDFDVICLWHVLEHVSDPLALLRDVRTRLRPDGRLVIEVPNIDSVGASIMRGRWAHLDPSAHVHHFTPRALSAALEAGGYAVIELETLIEGYYDHLSMRLRLRRIAGRVVRALCLRTLSLTHPAHGELLRVIASPKS